MLEKKPRRGIRSVEIAFRILSVMQASQQAMASKEHRAAGGPDDERGTSDRAGVGRGVRRQDRKP
ncbi:hypothetical protein XH98_01780 [Bradyrhizobium sp. CCBAU 51745]|nr:hypothetical protein [Bradyrhizobium sp. CCBAU 51745]